MTIAQTAELADRAIVGVTGDDAGAFLDNLTTNDLAPIAPGGARFAGMLSPQGKVLFEFFVVRAGEGYLLDTARDQAAGLVKRLAMYKLRAHVVIAMLPESVRVIAGWGGRPVIESPAPLALYDDPRLPALGWRAILVDGEAPAVTASAGQYHAHRIALGVPEGGKDYAFGDAFPHEAVFDQLNGVSFTKGCYVGQEIVARMEHRGTARKRIVRVTADAALPPAGTPVAANEAVIGAMGSSAGAIGLALLRLDRVAEFAAAGTGLVAAGIPLEADAGDIARLMPRAPDPVALG